MRSGWKRSNWSSFSPVEANRIGLPVTALTRQRRAAARVAVELAHHHAVELHGLGELLGDVDGVLAGHRVDDEQHVVRLAPPSRIVAELGHQLLVDVQAAGRVDDQHVLALRARRARAPTRAISTGSRSVPCS